jgi:hypothetical protein
MPIYANELSNCHDYPNGKEGAASFNGPHLPPRASLVHLEEIDCGPVFGYPLDLSLKVAKTSVALETKLGDPDVVIVPTVVAMCGKLLKERGRIF